MQTSRNGILFIACREALVLTAYQDGPHCSIGFGSNDPTLKPGDTITVKEAFDRLKAGIATREAAIDKALKVPVSQQQRDALMALHYQSGNRYLPAVAALCNAREFAVAADLFPLCDRNLAGEKSEGLLKRRLLERAIFLDGNYGALDAIPYWPGDPRTTKRQTYHLQPGDL